MNDHREELRRVGAVSNAIQRVINRTARRMYEDRARAIDLDGYDWKWAHATKAAKERWRGKAVKSLNGFIDNEYRKFNDLREKEADARKAA